VADVAEAVPGEGLALSAGATFVGSGVKWHDKFAGGAEIPMGATLW
jgi:hypothetical protein